MSTFQDPGDPISYAVLESGTSVYSADGMRLGSVSHVLAAEQEDIFDGIVIDDVDREVVGDGERHRFVDAPEVAHIYERAVILTIDAAACRGLPAPTENPGELTADPADQPSELGGKLRRAWDMISGNW